MNLEEFTKLANKAATETLNGLVFPGTHRDLFMMAARWAYSTLVKDNLAEMDKRHWIEPGEIIE